MKIILVLKHVVASDHHGVAIDLRVPQYAKDPLQTAGLLKSIHHALISVQAEIDGLYKKFAAEAGVSLNAREIQKNTVSAINPFVPGSSVISDEDQIEIARKIESLDNIRGKQLLKDIQSLIDAAYHGR
jgi:hypothetical protein